MYLSLNYAVAWTQKRPKTGKFKDDESPETSALGDAVHAIIAGEPIMLPELYPRHAEGMMVLFFVLRNRWVRDPRAFIHKAEIESPGVTVDELIMEPVETA